MIWKRCNIHADGCQEQYSLSDRALRELSRNPIARRVGYKSRYDACDNAACQQFQRAPFSLPECQGV